MMNASNITNPTVATKNPWKESGAMVYVALTVATFSAVTMCCVWFFKQRWLKITAYGTVNNEEEDIELTAGHESSEEDIPLEEPEYKDDPPEPSRDPAEPSPGVFTLDGSDESDADDHETYEAEHMDSV